jgi:hypothetical protein
MTFVEILLLVVAVILIGCAVVMPTPTERSWWGAGIAGLILAGVDLVLILVTHYGGA